MQKLLKIYNIYLEQCPHALLQSKLFMFVLQWFVYSEYG